MDDFVNNREHKRWILVKNNRLGKNFIVKIQSISFFVQIVFFLFPLIFILHIHQVSGYMCYDVTTDHKCPQENTNSVKTDGFNNKNLQVNYDVWSSAKSFFVKQSCNTASSSETNIVDIYHVIEHAQLSEREKFVCEMEVSIRQYMKGILEDRKFMKDYIERKKSNAFISEGHKIKMTSLLMRYRLLRNKRGYL